MTDIQQTAASRRRRPLALVGGLTMAAALAVAVAAGSNLGGGLPAPTDEPGNPAAGGGMAMCLAYDAANLPTMEVVFDGTVTAINGDQVTFQVNEGWKGADGSITLTALDPNVALIGPMPDFEVGGRYLVTAAEGNVNACGYTLDYDAGEAADWAAAFED